MEDDLEDWRHRFIETIRLPQNSLYEGNHTKDQKQINGGKRISCRKLALEMDMSSLSALRILRKDLKMKPYKITVEPLLKDKHKAQRKKFASWVGKKFRKDTMRILFPDETMFDLDSVYNS